jgi:succinate dehydrogenase flavin-adding protein (antitoxin of CptAB toxin-antitoxin module)
MNEMDLLTLGYLERHYPTAPVEERRAFAELGLSLSGWRS